MKYPVVEPNDLSPSELAAALVAIRATMSKRQLELLEAHFCAPHARLPVDTLGQYSPVVSLYGKIGGALSRYLKRMPGKYHLLWLTFQPQSDSSSVWQMRTNIREAIALLNWFTEPATALAHLHELESKLQVAIARSKIDSQEARLQRLRAAPRVPKRVTVQTTAYVRNPDVVIEVLNRACGNCECCNAPAPFIRGSDDSPYLEVHHTISLAEGGEDTVENAIAVCPNCHRARHSAKRLYAYKTWTGSEISNEELSLDHVPSINASLDEMGAFALTFDGYEYWGSFERCSEVAQGSRPESLAELRTCLFFSQRAWRHADGEASPHIDNEWRKLINLIRSAVHKPNSNLTGGSENSR